MGLRLRIIEQHYNSSMLSGVVSINL